MAREWWHTPAFAIERPDELRALVLGLVGRLADGARRSPTG
ncbi:hypothetical protein [Actinomadura sp. K4S16]|nr:hypothetical protein [Actinomadura sp. K4S16]